MTQYDNNMRGVLFKNDRKETSNHPDYKGTCEINGAQYWMSAWLKQDKNGRTFMSHSFSVKEDKPQSQHNEAKSNGYQPQDDFEDSEIPF